MGWLYYLGIVFGAFVLLNGGGMLVNCQMVPLAMGLVLLGCLIMGITQFLFASGHAEWKKDEQEKRSTRFFSLRGCFSWCVLLVTVFFIWETRSVAPEYYKRSFEFVSEMESLARSGGLYAKNPPSDMQELKKRYVESTGLPVNLTAHNPFPGTLGGDCYGWTKQVPPGWNRTESPLLWDWGTAGQYLQNEDTIDVLLWDGNCYESWRIRKLKHFCEENSEYIHIAKCGRFADLLED